MKSEVNGISLVVVNRNESAALLLAVSASRNGSTLYIERQGGKIRPSTVKNAGTRGARSGAALFLLCRW